MNRNRGLKGWESLKNLKVGVFETDFKQVPFVLRQTTHTYSESWGPVENFYEPKTQICVKNFFPLFLPKKHSFITQNRFWLNFEKKLIPSSPPCHLAIVGPMSINLLFSFKSFRLNHIRRTIATQACLFCFNWSLDKVRPEISSSPFIQFFWYFAVN